jgi:CTP synthase
MDILGKIGMIFSGVSPDKGLVEIVELKGHPWFLGCQFHPEFRSKPMDPHPLFREFIKASLRRGKRSRVKGREKSSKQSPDRRAHSA